MPLTEGSRLVWIRVVIRGVETIAEWREKGEVEGAEVDIDRVAWEWGRRGGEAARGWGLGGGDEVCDF